MSLIAQDLDILDRLNTNREGMQQEIGAALKAISGQSIFLHPVPNLTRFLGSGAYAGAVAGTCLKRKHSLGVLHEVLWRYLGQERLNREDA